MKIILSNDWHFGNAGNSIRHNQNIIDFIQWMINWSIKNEVEHFAHLGDLFHQRDKLDVNTIEYANKGIKMLNERFGKYIQLKGNHDLYLRDSRDICSLHMFDQYVDVVDKFRQIEDIMFTSWICTGEEYDELIKETKKNKTKYLLGHFEFSTFSMNDHYVMEHGQSHKELKHVDLVFSGHYHGRQIRDNIVYIGNPFPYDFNDANDPHKGFCVLDTDTGSYEFIDYQKILVIDLTPDQILEQDWSEFDQENISVRVIIEDEIENKKLDQIKDLLESTEFNTSKVVYKLTKKNDDAEITELDHVMSVDEAVLLSIDNMSDSTTVKTELLKTMYKDAINEQA